MFALKFGQIQKPSEMYLLQQKMRLWRKSKGDTLEVNARILGIVPSYLSRIERGEIPIPPAKLQLFLDHYQITVEELASFQGLDERGKTADPVYELNKQVEELKAQISRMQQNNQNFLNHNLYALEREEVDLRGEEGATQRALTRMAEMPALSIMLNHENTNRSYFLNRVMPDIWYAKKNEGFSEEKYLPKPGKKPGKTKK